MNASAGNSKNIHLSASPVLRLFLIFCHESSIWGLYSPTYFFTSDTCQVRSEQRAITFRLAYQTITVMTERRLWLQHGNQDLASW